MPGMNQPVGTLVSVIQLAVIEGARALGLKLVELLLGVSALAVVLAAAFYLVVSLRLAAVMERVRNL